MQTSFGKENPFLASIKERYLLSCSSSAKKTFHISLDLKGSSYRYHPGDSVAIYSHNDPQLVQRTLNAIKASGEELIIDKKGCEHVLRDFLTTKANITDVSRKFYATMLERQTNLQKQEHLQWLHREENREALKTYLEHHEVWDFLAENEEVSFSLAEIVSLLMPLLPRFYSIASAQAVVGEEVHLTIAAVEYNSNGHQRRGVCTYYLCHLAPLMQPVIPLYVHASTGFSMPADANSDIIMIGPGTGVAPFRAFMQQRALAGAGRNWLFFGEWKAAENYFYKDFWLQLVQENKLQVDTAFSRDQEDKIYVQHRMLEKGQELYQWLEKGASIFVCGDAHRMAKDVDHTLHQIVQIFGHKSEKEAKEYIKKLRADKKYLRDVY